MLKEKERKKETSPFHPLTKHCGGAAQAGSRLSSQGQAKENAFPSFYRWELWVRGHGNGLGGSRWSASVICLESFAGSRPPVLRRRAQPVLLFTVSPSFFNLHECSLLAATVPLTWYFMSSGLQSLLHKNKQPHVCPPSVSPALDKKLRTNWRARKLLAAGTHYSAFMLKAWIVLGVVPSLYPIDPYSWSDNAWA